MAVATFAAFEAAAKQGFTQESLEDQFYSEDPLLENIQRKTPSTTIGLVARTPVHTGRGAGYTAVPETGSEAINTASAEQLAEAQWKYKRHWHPIKIDTAAAVRTEGSANAVVDAVEVTVNGALSNMRKHLTRQLFLDGTAKIAKCAKEEAENKKVLLNTKTGELGFQAIRNGWLVVGQEIDVGTEEEEASVVDKKAIIAIGETEAEPFVELESKVKTAETNFVSIANARAGKVSNECNGFRALTSESTTLGGIEVAKQAAWKGNVIKAENTPITREKVLELQRKIRQKGTMPDWALTSLKQVEALENQLYPQVRFANPKDVNTGDGMTIMLGSIKVQGHNDCPDADLHLVKSDKIAALRTDKPEWVPQKYGGGKIFQWNPNTTFIVSAVEYFLELYTNRRNALGSLLELS